MPAETIIQPAITGQGITPQMPTEPTPEAKAMKFEFNSELFNKDGGETRVLVDKVEVPTEKAEIKLQHEVKEESKLEVKKEEPPVEKKVEIKPKEEKKSVLTPPKDETVKVADVVKPVEKKEVVKPITPKVADADTFDYTKYAPQEVTNMKNMSRPSREAYAKLIDENKQLSSLKDATYLQHEQGYTLSPEYQDITQRQHLAQVEGKAWEQALLAIREGKPFKEITAFDQQGRPVFSAEKTATPTDDIRISNNLTACITAVNQFNGQLQNYPSKFKQQISTDLQRVQSERANRFSWVSDPKILEHSVDVEGIGQVKLADIKKDFKSWFPPYLANTPGVEVAADMFIALQIKGAELREALNGQQVATTKKEELQRGEPSSDNVVTEDASKTIKGVPKVFTLEGMPV